MHLCGFRIIAGLGDYCSKLALCIVLEGEKIMILGIMRQHGNALWSFRAR